MRRKIIVFSNYYLPGVLAGGPIRSIEGLIKKLAEYKIILIGIDLFIKGKDIIFFSKKIVRRQAVN